MATITATNNEKMDYPGGMMAAGASVTASVTGTGSYTLTYDVNAEIDFTNILTTSKSSFKVTLYEYSGEETDLISGCDLKEEEVDATTKKYYYDGCTFNSNVTKGTLVKTETINKDTESAFGQKYTITYTGETLENVSSSSEKTTYYYLLVEYVNDENNDQNDDMNKEITASLTGVANGVATVEKE